MTAEQRLHLEQGKEGMSETERAVADRITSQLGGFQVPADILKFNAPIMAGSGVKALLTWLRRERESVTAQLVEAVKQGRSTELLNARWLALADCTEQVYLALAWRDHLPSLGRLE